MGRLKTCLLRKFESWEEWRLPDLCDGEGDIGVELVPGDMIVFVPRLGRSGHVIGGSIEVT